MSPTNTAQSDARQVAQRTQGIRVQALTVGMIVQDMEYADGWYPTRRKIVSLDDFDAVSGRRRALVEDMETRVQVETFYSNLLLVQVEGVGE